MSVRLGREATAGKCRPANSPTPMLTKKERNIATPPYRGSGVLCRSRSCKGGATQPRPSARLRTYRVSVREEKRETPKTIRYREVNKTLRSQRTETELYRLPSSVVRVARNLRRIAANDQQLANSNSLSYNIGQSSAILTFALPVEF